MAAAIQEGSPAYVAPEERIAIFDNDGTLGAEQPMYFQLAIAIDRLKTLAPSIPSGPTRSPSLDVAGDLEAVAAGGNKAILQRVMASHAGVTTDDFVKIITDWLTSARHPHFDLPYSELLYQPILELLACLRAEGFQTWIVSGGGVEFMRTFARRCMEFRRSRSFALPFASSTRCRATALHLVRLPEMNFLDDKAGKPVAMHQFIGRRPIMALGNSAGDLQMLPWTTLDASPVPRLGVIIRHTDAERKWADDRKSHVGHLEATLDEAALRKWIVVEMKRRLEDDLPGSIPAPEALATRRHEPRLLPVRTEWGLLCEDLSIKSIGRIACRTYWATQESRS